MKFRTILGTTIAAFALGATSVGVADAAPDDSVKGPPCADISADPHFFTPPVEGGQPTVVGGVESARPSCSRITYTMDVYTPDGTLLATVATVGNDTTTISLQWTAPSEEPLCVAFTSSDPNERQIDVVPNTTVVPCSNGIYLTHGGTGGSGRYQ